MTDSLIAQCEQYITERKISVTPNVRFKLRPRKLAPPDTDAAQSYIEKHRKLSFTEQLFVFIDRTGKRDSDIYKKANIDRRLFSKIRSNKNYVPCKKTVAALCLALELPRLESDILFESAGYSLSRADDYDLTIAFCIERKIYDFMSINEILDHFGFEVF